MENSPWGFYLERRNNKNEFRKENGKTKKVKIVYRHHLHNRRYNRMLWFYYTLINLFDSCLDEPI